MEKIYSGKTKDLFEENGKYFLKFKDDMTGTDGVFDTGGNEVAGSVEGAGHECIKVSKFFFEKIKDIPSHYVDADLDENLMQVKEATVFGKGLEVITRFKAVGSFIRRYGMYIEDGKDLNDYTEITIKDDKRNDPLITKDALVELNILTADEYETIVENNKKVARRIKDILAEHGLELYDIKLEWGRLKENN